jgi:hypothetical protein
MDSSSGSSSTAVEERQMECYDYDDEEEESRCNWDIEIISFVVESFICLFPDKGDDKRRVRQVGRGECGTSNATGCAFLCVDVRTELMN